MQVGRPVLQGLEAADGLAELHPRQQVVHGELQCPLGRPGQLGGQRHAGPVPGQRQRARRVAADATARGARQPDHGQFPGGVQGGNGEPGDAIAARVNLEQPDPVLGRAGDDQQHAGRRPVQHVVRLAGQLPGRTARPRAGQPRAGRARGAGGLARVPPARRGRPGQRGDR